LAQTFCQKKAFWVVERHAFHKLPRVGRFLLLVTTRPGDRMPAILAQIGTLFLIAGVTGAAEPLSSVAIAPDGSMEPIELLGRPMNQMVREAVTVDAEGGTTDGSFTELKQTGAASANQFAAKSFRNGASITSNISSRVDEESGIHWVTTFFQRPNSLRNGQLLCALLHNLLNPRIKQVHVLTEDIRFDAFFQVGEQTYGGCLIPDKYNRQPLQVSFGDKLQIIRTDSQPTYYMFASWVSSNLRGQLVAISNADIYMGVLPVCISPATMARRAFALSRKQSPDCVEEPHSITMCGAGRSSYDVMMLVPPLQNKTLEDMMVVHGGIPQNRWGAENIFMRFLVDDGFDVSNPCKGLDVFHMHCGIGSSAPGGRINVGETLGISRPSTNGSCKDGVFL